VLLGLAGAAGLSREARASDKAKKKKKKANKRVNKCYSNTEQVVGCDRLPSAACNAYVAVAESTCCEKARSSWGAFNRCMDANS
jgi:hypothetical protein